MPDGTRGAMPLVWGGSRAPNSGRAADRLPDYAMPPFDGIGANETIVAVTHDVCDFISTVDTPAVWELNLWYHLLNCGFRTRISGETDFPCIYGERVGLGRVYVEMPGDVPLRFEEWIAGLADGRSYVGDGMSHLSRFTVNGVTMGESSSNGSASVLKLDKRSKVRVATQVAALLPERPSDEAKLIQSRRLDEKPYWHLERSRVGETRRVPVELIVNGESVAQREIEADGNWNDLEWDIELTRSSWVAIRVFPSLHSNPIFVELDAQPIRVNRQSAAWCRQAVDVCWEQKKTRVRAEELSAAQAAYDHARQMYDRIIDEASASWPVGP
jgi:hypothetical protein